MKSQDLRKLFDGFTLPGKSGAREHRKDMIFVILLNLIIFTFFLTVFFNYRKGLYQMDHQGNITSKLMEGAMMPELNSLLGGCCWIVIIVLLYSIICTFRNYRSFFTESKSIYLMKRLPNKNETLVRCIGIPLMTLVIAIIVTAVMVGFCALIYYKLTPLACIPKGQTISIADLLLLNAFRG